MCLNSVFDFKEKTLNNAELIENKTLDGSNQEEMQPEEDFSETYTKGKKTPQSSMENVNSEGMEITENSTKSSYAEEEPEQVINTYTIENSEIKDSGRIKLEEASDIKEATGIELHKLKTESSYVLITFYFTFTQGDVIQKTNTKIMFLEKKNSK